MLPYLTALFVLFCRWNGVGGLCFEKVVNFFEQKKVHPGNLAGGFSDIEMIWLPYCAGDATARNSFTGKSFSSILFLPFYPLFPPRRTVAPTIQLRDLGSAVTHSAGGGENNICGRWICSIGLCSHTAFRKKTGPVVISSYPCFDSYELRENFQKYIGGVVCCEYEINVCDSLTFLCWYYYNETAENYHVNKHKTRFTVMQNMRH